MNRRIINRQTEMDFVNMRVRLNKCATSDKTSLSRSWRVRQMAYFLEHTRLRLMAQMPVNSTDTLHQNNTDKESERN